MDRSGSARRNTSRKKRGSQAQEDDVQSVLKVGSNYYILASSASFNRSTGTLADGETFAVFQTDGDFLESPHGSCGLFHRDARHLSRFEMRIESKPPFFLNSHLSEDNLEFAVNLTKSDLYKHGDVVSLPRGSVRMERNWTLTGPVLYGRMRLHNFTQSLIRLPIRLLLAADFADLFEVRGVRLALRGKLLTPSTEDKSVRLGYSGRDGRDRFTQLTFNPAPAELNEKSAHFPLVIEAGETAVLDVRICCTNEPHSRPADHHRITDFDGAIAARRAQLASRRAARARITTSNEPLNLLLKRSLADLTTIVSPRARRRLHNGGNPLVCHVVRSRQHPDCPFGSALQLRNCRRHAAHAGPIAGIARGRHPR